MEDNGVQILAEILSSINKEDINVVFGRYQRVPDYLYTEDFSQRYLDISLFRTFIISNRWRSFFDDCCQRMFSSHKTYLAFVMFACINEQRYHNNILDSFVSAGAVVGKLMLDTLQKTRVNFYDLETDILMVYYKNELKSIFGKHASFHSFEKHIRPHKLVNKECVRNALEWNNAIRCFEENGSRKFKKELKELTSITINPKDVENNTKSKELADLVLSIPDIRLPSLPCRSDLIKRLLKFRRNELNIAEEKDKTEMPAKCEASNVDSSGIPSSNSESKAIYVTEPDSPISNAVSEAIYGTKHPDNIKWHEDVIQAVIRHNHSKNSSKEKENGHIMQEVEGTLEHLKEGIQSLLEVLNEYNDE